MMKLLHSVLDVFDTKSNITPDFNTKEFESKKQNWIQTTVSDIMSHHELPACCVIQEDHSIYHAIEILRCSKESRLAVVGRNNVVTGLVTYSMIGKWLLKQVNLMPKAIKDAKVYIYISLIILIILTPYVYYNYSYIIIFIHMITLSTLITHPDKPEFKVAEMRPHRLLASVSPQAKAINAFKLLHTKHLGGCAVTNPQNNELIDTISTRDLRGIGENREKLDFKCLWNDVATFKSKVRQAYSDQVPTQPVTCAPEATFEMILRMLVSNHLHRVYIVTDRKPLDVVSIVDLVNFIVDTVQA